MDSKNSPQNVINSFRRRQQMTPFIIGGFAVLLVAVGVIILITWFSGPNQPALSILASKTPTPTETATVTPVTPTLTFTPTFTITNTATVTETTTPTGPFQYTVKEGDICWDLATTYKIDLQVLLAINGFPPDKCPIVAGQKILIPAPGQALPTDTPIPADIAKGTKINYVVKTGDTMGLIAARFNTTVDAVMAATNDYNKKNNLPELTDVNKIQVGMTLVIPVQIVTPTSTRAATSTVAATVTVTPTSTPKP